MQNFMSLTGITFFVGVVLAVAQSTFEHNKPSLCTYLPKKLELRNVAISLKIRDNTPAAQ